MGFNPLEQIKEEYMNGNYAEAELLAQAFSYSIFNPDSPANTDSFWQDTSSSLLTALILAHVDDCLREHEEEKINMYSIINTFTELATITNEKNPNVTALDSYFAQRPALDRAKMKYMCIRDSIVGATIAKKIVNQEINSIQILKKDAVTGKPLANATFKIRSKETGEDITWKKEDGSSFVEFTTGEMCIRDRSRSISL